MKRVLSVAIISLLALIGIVISARLLSPEDAWICSNDQWVEHGQPTAAKPTTGCETQAPACETIANQSVCESRSDCLPVYDCACTTDQARAERCGKLSSMICDCYGEGFNRCDALTCNNNANQSITDVDYENIFEDKIVYSTGVMNVNISTLEADCAQRGGKFNRCGSACPSSAEFCIEICALTCELTTAVDGTDL